MRNGACGADGWTSGGHVVVAAALATLPFSPAGLADGFGEGSLRPAVAGFTPTTGSPAARLLPRARLCGLQMAVYPPAAIIAALARERNPDAPPRTTRKMLAKEILPAHSLSDRARACCGRQASATSNDLARLRTGCTLSGAMLCAEKHAVHARGGGRTHTASRPEDFKSVQGRRIGPQGTEKRCVSMPCPASFQHLSARVRTLPRAFMTTL